MNINLKISNITNFFSQSEKKAMVKLKIIHNKFSYIKDNIKILPGKLYSKKIRIVEICSADRVTLLLKSLSVEFTAILMKNFLFKI